MPAIKADRPAAKADKKAYQELRGYTASLQGGWPMVEDAVHQARPPVARTSEIKSSEMNEQARGIANSVEARTGLPRTGGGAPSLDRKAARALVEAGYMPLSDYVALYGGDVGVEQKVRQAEFHESTHLTGQFPVAFPRRQTYRLTSFRCTFAKPPPRSRRKA